MKLSEGRIYWTTQAEADNEQPKSTDVTVI